MAFNPNTSNQIRGVAILSLLVLLERLAYYGMRSILVLFLIDQTGLGLTNDTAFNYYTWFMALVAIASLPMGALTDFVLKQRTAIIAGGILLLLGYLFTAQSSLIMVIIGLFIIAFGSGLAKVNLNVLVGRLFEKTNDQRDVGFIFLYMALNIGAFLASLVVATVAESSGWNVGFYICAAISLLFLLLFLALKALIVDVESASNLELRSLSNSGQADLLDHNMDEETSKNSEGSHGLKGNWPAYLILFTVASVLFWGIYTWFGADINQILNSFVAEMGVSQENRVGMMLQVILLLVLAPVLGIIWILWKNPKPMVKIATGFIALTISLLLFYIWHHNYQIGSTAMILSIPLVLAIAEIFVSPIAISGITRYAPAKFASTIMGGFLLLSYLGSKFFEWTNVNLTQNPTLYLILAGATLAIALAILFVNKRL